MRCFPARAAARPGRRGRSSLRAAHRAHDAQVARCSVADEAGAVSLEFGRLGELRLRHARQREVVEEDLRALAAGAAAPRCYDVFDPKDHHSGVCC